MFYEQCTVSMQSHRYTLKKHGAAIALEFNFSSKFSRTVEKADCARKKKAPRAAGRDFPSQLNDQRKLGLFGDRFPALSLRCAPTPEAADARLPRSPESFTDSLTPHSAIHSQTGPVRSTRMRQCEKTTGIDRRISCLLYTSPSPRDMRRSRMPSSA